MIGALTQPPTHSTSVMVNTPSALVSPQPLMPVASRQAASTSSEPRSQHGVVVHTCRCHMPIGFSVEHEVERRNLVDANRRHIEPCATAFIPAVGTQALPVCRFSWFCTRYSIGSTALACLPGGYFASELRIAASLSASKAKCPVARSRSCHAYLSISPNTMSSDPMIATASASMCRFAITSIACRNAKPVARILQRYGRLVPSATR